MPGQSAGGQLRVYGPQRRLFDFTSIMRRGQGVGAPDAPGGSGGRCLFTALTGGLGGAFAKTVREGPTSPAFRLHRSISGEYYYYHFRWRAKKRRWIIRPQARTGVPSEGPAAHTAPLTTRGFCQNQLSLQWLGWRYYNGFAARIIDRF
jgi:hypothetical protein